LYRAKQIRNKLIYPVFIAVLIGKRRFSDSVCSADYNDFLFHIFFSSFFYPPGMAGIMPAYSFCAKSIAANGLPHGCCFDMTRHGTHGNSLEKNENGVLRLCDVLPARK